MRRRAGERPGHTGTTAHFQAIYPFLGQGGLGVPGAYIGRDAYGGAWMYDPWALYGPGILADQNMLLLGKIGYRKSSLVKTYLFRQALFGRQSWVLDVKGEYGPLANALGGTVISLRPGGEVRLNPLSRRGDRAAQLLLLRSVAKAALRRELSSEEDAGLRVALELVNAEHRENEPTLPDVVDALLRPRTVMVEGVSASSSESFAQANRACALALQRLCEGDLQGMFDGPTTPGIDLDAPIVVLDLSAMQDSTALGILMTCAAAWLQAIMLERKRIAELGGGSGIKLILVVEEGSRLTGHIGVAEWLQGNFKLCRSLGVQNIIVLHNISDLGTSGAQGSREAKLAEGLIADAGTKVIYAQSSDQVEPTRNKFGLSGTEAQIIPTLGRGEALWIVGQQHSELVQHRVSAFERKFIYNDHRVSQAQTEARV
jgi:type IV secretory pathway VirB4 component